MSKPVIGLVGGLGVGAAVHYYRELAAATDRIGQPLQLSMVHAQMSRVFEHASAGDRDGLARYLAGIFSQLQASGATIGVIPALTPHLAIDELLAIAPLPLVSMLDAVNTEIAARGLKRVALLGTRFVVESNLFGKLQGVDVVRPSADDITIIHDTYSQLAREGAVTDAKRTRLIEIAQSLCDRHSVDAILLAGTDLAVLFNETNTPFPSLDCARAHIEAIVRAVEAPRNA
jgi:aspartate racemase